MNKKQPKGEVYPELIKKGPEALSNANWRWRIRAANGRIIASSGEFFTRKTDAVRALTNVVQTIGSVAVRSNVASKEAVFEIHVLDGLPTKVVSVPCTA